MNETIRVVIVDDHHVVRRGLSVLLMAYEDLNLVGEAASGEEAIELCQQIQPDVVLMDVMMPGMNGVEATKFIRQHQPQTQVIILTSIKEDHTVQEALKSGAIGYLLKDVSADKLAEGIRAAAKGTPTLAPEATQALINVAKGEAKVEYHLTDRELEVLALMVKGLTNPEIAERLVISRSTVKFHVSTILSKLGATSRTEATVIAVQNNLVR